MKVYAYITAVAAKNGAVTTGSTKCYVGEIRAKFYGGYAASKQKRVEEEEEEH